MSEKKTTTLGGVVETPKAMRSWRVVRDLQGGTFGMGRAYTTKEWAETALEWTDSDGNDTEPLRKLFDELLEQGKEKEVIDTIAEWWWLEFGEVIGKRNYQRP